MRSVSQRLLIAIVTFFTLLLFNKESTAEHITWKVQVSLKGVFESPMRQPVFIEYDSDKDLAYIVDVFEKAIYIYNADGKLLSIVTAGRKLRKPTAAVRISKNRFLVIEREEQSISILDIAEKSILRNKICDKNYCVWPDKLIKFKDFIFTINRLTGEVLMFDKNLKEFKPITNNNFIDIRIKNNKIFGLNCIKREICSFSFSGKNKSCIKLSEKTVFPYSFDIDSKGRFFVLDRMKGKIDVYSPYGNLLYSFSSKGESSGHLYYPAYLLIDNRGRVWVADEGNGRVEVFAK